MGKELDEAIARARKLTSGCLEGYKEGWNSPSTLEMMLKDIAKEISPSFKGMLAVEDRAIIEQPGNRVLLSISFLPDGTIRNPGVCDDVVKRYL